MISGCLGCAARAPRRVVCMADDEENEVYLSAKLIRQWQDEYVELVNERTTLTTQINELNQKAGVIISKLGPLMNKKKAAAPFSGKIAEWIQEQEFNSAPDNVTLTSAILKALVRNQVMNRNMLQH